MSIQVYACYLMNKDELNKSSSGGAFTAISNAIFTLGGTVIACKYNYDKHILEFDKAIEENSRNQMRGSKYIQADPTKLYELLFAELSIGNETPILLIGTPCQIAGVKLWIKLKKIKTIRKIIYCDLMCHGVSSPVIWKKYISSLEGKAASNLLDITFKDKEKGWIRPTAKASFENGKSILAEDYAMLYRSDNFMRESCYHCKFANLDRETDITIGDFWSIKRVDPEFANMQGTSCVLIHTEVGGLLFNEAKNHLIYKEKEIEECIQPNLEYATRKSPQYDDIHKDYREKGLQYIIERYVHYGPGNEFVRKLRKKYFNLKYRR